MAITVYENGLEASYHAERLIARQKKPHTHGKTLTKLAWEFVQLILESMKLKK